MAQAGHAGEAQVTVAPAQHPVPGAPGCSGARSIGNRVHSLPAHQRQGGRHSTAASCRGQTSHSTPTRPRACPGNALQAPAADAGDAGFAQLQTRTHADVSASAFRMLMRRPTALTTNSAALSLSIASAPNADSTFICLVVPAAHRGAAREQRCALLSAADGIPSCRRCGFFGWNCADRSSCSP